MPSEINVTIGGFSQTSIIAIGPSEISQVWLGADLLWEKSGVGSVGTWTPATADSIFMVPFTPTSNVQLSTIEMVLDIGGPVYNYITAVYDINRNMVVSETGNSGVSFLTEGTIDGSVSYRHKKDFLGSGPSLTSGMTYYIGIGERYKSYRALSLDVDDAGAGVKVLGWSLTNATSQPYVDIGATTYLKVTTV